MRDVGNSMNHSNVQGFPILKLTRGPIVLSWGSDCRSEGPADTGRIFSVCVAALHISTSKDLLKLADGVLLSISAPFEALSFVIWNWSICIVLSLSSTWPCKKTTCLRKSVSSSAILLPPLPGDVLTSAVPPSFRV